MIKKSLPIFGFIGEELTLFLQNAINNLKLEAVIVSDQGPIQFSSWSLAKTRLIWAVNVFKLCWVICLSGIRSIISQLI